MKMSLNDLILPLESAEFVMQNSKSVQINQNGVENLAKKIYESLKDKNCNYFNWKSSTLNPKKMNEFSINWIFLVDTLNFSFWSDNELMQLPDNFKKPIIERYTVTYNQIPYSGYWALCAAINRALDVKCYILKCQNRFILFKSIFQKEGYPITEAHYFAHISEQELKHIFRSDTSVQIPLFEHRLRVLQETGKILIEVM